MEIRPASLAQLSRGRDGQLIEIGDDVQGVANALHQIDHHISLRFSETGGYFVAYWKPDGWEDGAGYVITTAQDLDHRLVKRIEKVYEKCKQPGYSFSDEVAKEEEKAKADLEHERSEEQGPILERLAHAMRKDTGYDKQKVFITKGVK